MKNNLLLISIINLPFFLCVITINSSKQIPTNEDLFSNKSILILGGTGYLGRTIAMKVLKYNPKKVIIFSRDEVKHSQIKQFFENDPRIYSIVGDIRDYSTLLNATKSVDIVFHTAALKRVEILEENPKEAVKTNVLGALNVYNACLMNKVPKVLFVSSDKACLPVNAYGASKFIAEKIFTNGNSTDPETIFVATRFGNIFESTGSVVPFFINKIKNGEDIPLTDPRMTRFMISKEEATDLIFDALRYGIGGEIFIKKLPAFKITDLIDFLKELFNADNRVKIVGLRPGEKIHEVMINEAEIDRTYAFNNCYIIVPSIRKLESADNIPIYASMGRLLHHEELDHYSSDQEVVSKKELMQLFENSLYVKGSLL